MEVDVVNICRVAWYMNLWELNNKERITNNSIQLYMYLDAPWDLELKMLRFIDEAMKK